MVLYADENFPLRVVEELRRLGADVLTVLEDGRANQSVTDQAILARATELGRAILTLNRKDFKGGYMFKWPIMPGLLSVQRIPIGSVKRKGSLRQSPIRKS